MNISIFSKVVLLARVLMYSWVFLNTIAGLINYIESIMSMVLVDHENII